MKVVAFKVDDETYKKLEELARSKGLLSVSEVAKIVLLKALEEGAHHKIPSSDVEGGSHRARQVIEKLLVVIDRKIQDKINPFTSKIDDLARKYAELVERIESLEDRIRVVEQRVASIEDRLGSAVKTGTTVSSERSELKKERKKRSVMEILREQGVLFESDIANRIRDRDTFFLKLQRLGAVVLELKNERVAVDPEFWKEFIDKVQKMSTNSEEEIAKILDEREFRLFKALRESALIYFDAVSGRWRLLI